MKTFLTIALVALFSTCILAASLPAYPEFFTVTSDNVLSRYNSMNINNVITSVPISGLSTDDEHVLDIDIRPSTGALYAISLDFNTSVSKLYTIDLTTTGAVASLVGLLDGCTLYAPTYPYYESSRYGMSFDPVNDNLRISGQDTQNFQVDPATGVCTKMMNHFFNGNSGRGSTPTRAIAFSNNLLPSSSSYMYLLTGAHFTITNTADHAGVYVIRYSVTTDGPFDIHTRSVGSSQINVPLIITPTYDSTNFVFDYSNMILTSISLETGVQETIGTFNTPAPGVYFYGMTTIPVGWTGPISLVPIVC